MPTVSSDVLRFLQAGLKTEFVEAYRRKLMDSPVPKIASVLPTTLPTQDYAQLTSNPTMRAWTDERVKKAIKAFSTYSITDITWESTLAVSRRTIEDDQYGMIRMQAVQLGMEPARHQHQLVVTQYALGATTKGLDTTANFIDTTHNESGTNQSNKTTSALSSSTLQTAIQNMMLFTDDQGVPLGITPDTLLVGPSNMFNARQILNSAFIVGYGGGTNTTTPNQNVLQGALPNLVVSPYLAGTYANYWFVIDSSRAVKPIILQERSDVPLEFQARENPDDPSVFDRDEYLYGARARYNVGFGLWQTCYGGIL